MEINLRILARAASVITLCLFEELPAIKHFSRWHSKYNAIKIIFLSLGAFRVGVNDGNEMMMHMSIHCAIKRQTTEEKKSFELRNEKCRKIKELFARGFAFV